MDKLLWEVNCGLLGSKYCCCLGKAILSAISVHSSSNRFNNNYNLTIIKTITKSVILYKEPGQAGHSHGWMGTGSRLPGLRLVWWPPSKLYQEQKVKERQTQARLGEEKMRGVPQGGGSTRRANLWLLLVPTCRSPLLGQPQGNRIRAFLGCCGPALTWPASGPHPGAPVTPRALLRALNFQHLRW